MEGPISIDEVQDTIKALKLSKAPGPDGFGSEYYKMLSPSLGPHLKSLFNNIISAGSIPDGFNEALITVLPKPGKDHLLVESYRPISLLNVDFKIFFQNYGKQTAGHLG